MRVAIFLLFLTFSVAAIATETFKCEFTSFSDEKGHHTERIELSFIIDDSTGKSYILGNNGSNEVAHIDRGNGKSFIEITALGNVVTTTMDLKMKAVHSRNSVGFTGELIPSQYYGACVKK